MILLAQETPLAVGTERAIYAHPGKPDYLLKVRRDTRPVLSARGLRGALVRRVAAMRLRGDARERAAYAALLRHPNFHPARSPAPLWGERVETDQGPAQEVERITTRGRALGRTLSMIHQAGEIDKHTVAMLNDFVERAMAVDLCAGDIRPWNLALGDALGYRTFFLVDGLGDTRAVPLRAWSKRINRIAMVRDCATMARRVGLDWDASKRRFALPA